MMMQGTDVDVYVYVVYIIHASMDNISWLINNA